MKTKDVKTLIKKAAASEDSDDAMKLSKAALDAVNALYMIQCIEQNSQRIENT